MLPFPKLSAGEWHRLVAGDRSVLKGWPETALRQPARAIVPHSNSEIREFNPNHEPAGSPKGGEFAPAARSGTFVAVPGKPVIVYHGTSVAAAKQIREHGLLASRNADTRGRAQSVYVTRSFTRARYYASWKGLTRGDDGYFHGDVAIVELAIPKNLWRKYAIHDDQDGESPHSYRFEQDIPASLVKSIDVITDGGAVRRLTESNSSTVPCYVVVQCMETRR